MRFMEFFAANIRNPNTRLAYAHAIKDFFTWCDHHAPPNCMTAPAMKLLWMRLSGSQFSAMLNGKQRLKPSEDP